MNDTVSVIIATMNRPEDLEKAIQSVLIQTRLPQEIWVIDQSVNDLSREVVEKFKKSSDQYFGLIHYVRQEERSLVKARNRGIACAKGSILSFLDDDIVLDADYFEKILSAFNSDENVVAVSGNARILEKWNGWKWNRRKNILHFFLISFNDGKMTPSGMGYPIFDYEISRLMEVNMLPGCNMNFKRQAVGQERFDEWFKGYSYREDAEFSYRISKKGRVLMIPDAKLWHYYSTANRLDMPRLKRMKIKNYYYVFNKFKGRNFFYRLLFFYSLTGLALIDFVEFLSHRNRERWEVFTAGISETAAILGGKNVQ